MIRPIGTLASRAYSQVIVVSFRLPSHAARQQISIIDQVAIAPEQCLPPQKADHIASGTRPKRSIAISP
jgi:hypothetical protein